MGSFPKVIKICTNSSRLNELIRLTSGITHKNHENEDEFQVRQQQQFIPLLPSK
jgi:hypothetical protein